MNMGFIHGTIAENLPPNIPPANSHLNGGLPTSINVRLQDVNLSAVTETLQSARTVLTGDLPLRLLSPDSKPDEGMYKLRPEAPGELNRQLVDQLCRVSANFDAIREELQLQLTPIYDQLGDISMRIITSGISNRAEDLQVYLQILAQLRECLSKLKSIEKGSLELLETRPELLGGLELFDILVEARGISVRTDQSLAQSAENQQDSPQSNSSPWSDTDDEQEPDLEQDSPASADSKESTGESNDYTSMFLKLARTIMDWPVAQWPGQRLFDPHALLRTQLSESVAGMYLEISNLIAVLMPLESDTDAKRRILNEVIQPIFSLAGPLLSHSSSLRLNYLLIAPAVASCGYVPRHRRDEIAAEQAVEAAS